MMIFNVPSMTCGHCEATVTKAIQGVDQSAVVKVDLAANKIEVASSAGSQAIIVALEEAGYPSSLAA